MTKRKASFVLAAALCGATVGWTRGSVEHRSVALVEAARPPLTIVVQRTWLGEPPMFDAFAETQAWICRSPRVLRLALSDSRWTGDTDLAAFAERLSVERIRRSALIQIAFRHLDPNVAQLAVELVTHHALELAENEHRTRLDALRAERAALATEYYRLRGEQAGLVGTAVESRRAATLESRAESTKRVWLRADRRVSDLEAGVEGMAQPGLLLVLAAQRCPEPASDSRPALAALGGAIALVLSGGAAADLGR